MVARSLDSASFFVSSPLLGRLTVRIIVGRGNSTIRNLPAGICFRFGRIINYDDFLRETIFVKSIPIGFARATTLSRGLRVGSRGRLSHGASRITRVVSRARFLDVMCRARSRRMCQADTIRSRG